jgi:hypothetical protein
VQAQAARYAATATAKSMAIFQIIGRSTLHEV